MEIVDTTVYDSTVLGRFCPASLLLLKFARVVVDLQVGFCLCYSSHNTIYQNFFLGYYQPLYR